VGLVEELLGSASPERLLEIASMLSRLHRVQGSEGLVEAAKRLAERLEEEGLEARLEVRVGALGLWGRWFFSEPRGWRLGRVVVEARGRLGWRVVDTSSSGPMVAVAHTPPGSAEGLARLCRDCSTWSGGSVPVVSRPRSAEYWCCTGRGASALIYTHDGPGYRYYSIYPPPFLHEPRAPAASLRWRDAVKLDGTMVRVSVEAEYTDPRTPVLRVRVGGWGDPAVLLVAHVCHPRPGAHDNASGVAVAVEAIRLLAARERELREKGVAVEALIVPEYTGSAYALDEASPSPGSLLAAVSLDMVGADLAKTGGSLLLVQSLYTLPSPLDPLLYRYVYEALSTATGFWGEGGYPEEGFHLQPYGSGSDHDIALSHGVPASMLNEWPDKYYHTSMDSPSNLSGERMARIAAGVAAAVLRLPGSLDSYRSLLQRWVRLVASEAWAGRLGRARPDTVADAMKRGVEAVLGRTAGVMGWSWSGGGGWEEDLAPRRRGPVTRLYAVLSGDEELLSLLDDESSTHYRDTAAIAASATRSTRAVEAELLAHGVKPEAEKLALIYTRLSG